MPRIVRRPSRWGLACAVLALVGLAIRLTYLYGWQYHVYIGGDSFYYHYGANLLADGKGFLQPQDFYFRHWTVQAAEHPPLYIVLLAAESLLGLRSYTDHQFFSCLMGTATIVVVAITARRLFGPKAGLLAGAIVAVYPYFWLNDAAVLAEGLAQLTTAITVYLAYVFWTRRSWGSAIWLGVGIALATLSRAEALILPVLLTLPLAFFLREVSLRKRLGLFLVSGVAASVVLAPWVGYNLTRFDKPVTISSGFDITLLSASCDETYYGRLRGYWSFNCVKDVPRQYQDLSDQAVVYRKLADDYIKAHQRVLPQVLLAREGRTWGWYHPAQIPELDARGETKPLGAGRVGMVMLYSLEIASLFGAVVMRRRRLPLIPLVALLINVCISSALTFGQTRYRSSAEVALVLLATAGFAGLAEARAKRRGRHRDGGVEPVERELQQVHG